MKHEKTFDAIGKLKDIELELHRLKNALEMANKGLDAQRQWVELTDDEYQQILIQHDGAGLLAFYNLVETKLKEKNT